MQANAAVQTEVARSSVEAKAKVKPARHLFIDLLRGFALVVMIETHVLNAYLPANARNNIYFFWLSFLNGLVAPSFLFASGFSIILQANRQWDDWLHFGVPFWRQLRRLGFIVMVAYYFHLQDFKLSKYLHPADPALWQKTLQVDVLQCIVASLLVVHALIFLTRRRSRFLWAAALVGTVAAVATPRMWAHDFRGQLPLAWALFLNPHGTSLFPLFPWICFILAGSCSACLFLSAIERGKGEVCVNRGLLAGVAMIAAGLVLRPMPFTLPGYANYFTTSPLYVLVRLGCVLIIGGVLFRFERAQWRLPRSVLTAGQESLLVYGAHLALIYGFFRGKFMTPYLGRQAGYAVCFTLSAALIVLMLWLAGRWHRLKRDYPSITKKAQMAAVLIMIAIFISL
jgi:uncharacterized membrane protein